MRGHQSTGDIGGAAVRPTTARGVPPKQGDRGTSAPVDAPEAVTLRLGPGHAAADQTVDQHTTAGPNRVDPTTATVHQCGGPSSGPNSQAWTAHRTRPLDQVGQGVDHPLDQALDQAALLLQRELDRARLLDQPAWSAAPAGDTSTRPWADGSVSGSNSQPTGRTVLPGTR
jgi:hypothetical protein